MKKKNFEVYADCDCDPWEEALVEELFSLLGKKVEEVRIYDTDGKRIYCRARVRDESLEHRDAYGRPGGWDLKDYIVKYYIVSQPWEPILLSFDFYDDERAIEKYITHDGSISYHNVPHYIDMGMYKITFRRGKIKCIRLENAII